MNTKNGGYVGLLALLITVAIIALITWRSDLFSNGDNKGNTQSVIERDLGAIDSARDAKNMLAQNNLKSVEGL